MKQLIVEIDEGTSVSNMSVDLQKAIADLNLQWPQSKMIGTKAVAGKQLVLLLSTVDAATLERLMNVEYPTGEFDPSDQEITIAFNLGWRVVAEEGQTVDQSLILPFMLDDIEVDASGTVIGSVPVTSVTGRLQTFSGRDWTY